MKPRSRFESLAMSKWYDKYLSIYGTPFKDVPEQIRSTIKRNIQDKHSPSPVVSLVVIAYNEECRLASCLWSLSDMVSAYPIEIIGVNNNSKDATEDVFKSLDVEYYNETRQSPGYARQCGMDHAHGKYHFFIDADTMYPSCYVDQMMKKLIKDDVSCVGTLWSFYPDKQHSQAELFFFEFVRDTLLWMQHFKRPELCVRGMTMAFNMDYAKHLSVRTDIRRGEDGSLALELKSYGKIDFLYCRKARPITGYGTLGNRSMFDIFVERVRIQSKRLLGIFHKQDHYEDTDSNLIK